MDRIRPAAVAGSFYPSETEELGRLIDECFESNPLGPQGARSPSPSLIGGLVPHAGYIYSGPCAAHFYALLNNPIERVILLGVNHQARGHRAALSPADFWQTPLGTVRIDRELNHLLQDAVRFLKQDEVAHAREHSIEVQLPFLQRAIGEFSLIPISLAHISIEECLELGTAVADVLRNRQSGTRTVIIASSDLSHYLSPKETAELDGIALEQVLALNPRALIEAAERENITMCGLLPTAVLLFAANLLGAKQACLLKHCHSGDIAPMRKVVGYASVALEL
ncbi:MAG TPA: AmmeMemoRadiSam system protein B [Candidatus Binatia bacterium]|nr:AmmeMemoRadiSam system protein B [Candidatus Binatia bacterium]